MRTGSSTQHQLLEGKCAHLVDDVELLDGLGEGLEGIRQLRLVVAALYADQCSPSEPSSKHRNHRKKTKTQKKTRQKSCKISQNHTQTRNEPSPSCPTQSRPRTRRSGCRAVAPRQYTSSEQSGASNDALFSPIAEAWQGAHTSWQRCDNAAVQATAGLLCSWPTALADKETLCRTSSSLHSAQASGDSNCKLRKESRILLDSAAQTEGNNPLLVQQGSKVSTSRS